MEILLYILAILIFLGLVILAIFLSNKKDKKRIEALKDVLEENNTVKTEILTQQTVEDIENTISVAKSEETKLAEGQVIQAEFEDFSVQFEDEPGISNASDDEDELDLKFAEYQKFLRENLNLDSDDNEVDNGFDGNMYQDNFPRFDGINFESLNRENIEDDSDLETILRDMHPKARDIVLSSALEKKEIDDEETVEDEDEQK